MYKDLKDKTNNYLVKNYNNIEFLISGRAAIDLAIKEIIANKNIRKAYLPSYLCDSMIGPFIDNGVEIEFYDITYDGKNFDIDTNKLCNTDNSIVLYCDYFIANKNMYNKLANSISSNSVLIHDVTHTLFSKQYDDCRDDFIVCSIRKWFVTIDGGLLISKNTIKSNLKPSNTDYITLKKKSRIEKEKYYQTEELNCKERYLLFSELAEYELNKNYSLCLMSTESFDIINDIDFDSFFDNKRELFNAIFSQLKHSYTILNGSNEENCIFTIPLVNLEDRNSVYKLFMNSLIRCAIMWDYDNSKIYQDYVDKSLCVDISENTLKKIKILTI